MMPRHLQILVADDMSFNRRLLMRHLTVMPPFNELGWVRELAPMPLSPKYLSEQ